MKLPIRYGLSGEARRIEPPPQISPVFGFSLWLRWSATVAWGGDAVNVAQPLVQHPASQAWVDLIEGVGSRDHGGEFAVISRVKELVEFLAHPGGHRLGAQIIQNQ